MSSWSSEANSDFLEVPLAGPDRVLAGIPDEQQLHVSPTDPARQRDRLPFELDRRPWVADGDVEAERDQRAGLPRRQVVFDREPAGSLDEGDALDRASRL